MYGFANWILIENLESEGAKKSKIIEKITVKVYLCSRLYCIHSQK